VAEPQINPLDFTAFNVEEERGKKVGKLHYVGRGGDVP